MNFQRQYVSISLAFLILLVHAFPASVCAQESPADLSGFEPAEIFEVKDGGPVKIGDEILTRLLLRCFQVSDKSQRQASHHTISVSVKDVSENPLDYRFYSFQISGTAREFKSFQVNSDDLLLGGFHLMLITDGAGNECLVALPVVMDDSQLDSIPDSWVQGELLDQQVSFVGFFLGLRSFDDEKDNAVSAPNSLQNKLDPPVFVARKIKWHPNRSSEKFQIDETDLILSEDGVDFNQLRQVGKNRNSRIGVDEALSFYQMLKAASRIDGSQIAIGDIGLESMLQEPEACRAKPVSLTGHVRRITEIPVEDDEIRSTLGIQKYFQIDMFVPLDDRKIVIKPPGKRGAGQKAPDHDTSTELVIENRFPVTVCTCSLPLDKDQINRNRLTVQGFFFKNWSYESELSIESQSGAQQIAPLIIALEPKMAPLGPNYFSWLLTAFSIVVLFSALLLAWLMRPGKSVSQYRTMPDRIEVTDREI